MRLKEVKMKNAAGTVCEYCTTEMRRIGFLLYFLNVLYFLYLRVL